MNLGLNWDSISSSAGEELGPCAPRDLVQRIGNPSKGRHNTAFSIGQ